jgi:hypothetical protein
LNARRPPPRNSGHKLAKRSGGRIFAGHVHTSRLYDTPQLVNDTPQLVNDTALAVQGAERRVEDLGTVSGVELAVGVDGVE